MSFVPSPRMFRSVSLEISLKPFFDSTPETRRAVCRELFFQWLPVYRHAASVDIMLWASDGSEILDYRGDLNEPFEWARYLGGANRLLPGGGSRAPRTGAVGRFAPARTR